MAALLERPGSLQLGFVQADPDFRRTAQVVVRRAEPFEFTGEAGVLDREPLDFSVTATVFVAHPFHGGAGPGRRLCGPHVDPHEVKSVHAGYNEGEGRSEQ